MNWLFSSTSHLTLKPVYTLFFQMPLITRELRKVCVWMEDGSAKVLNLSVKCEVWFKRQYASHTFSLTLWFVFSFLNKWLVGGSDGTHSLVTTELFDEKNQVWVQGPNLTSPRANVSVIEVAGKLYAIGEFETEPCKWETVNKNFILAFQVDFPENAFSIRLNIWIQTRMNGPHSLTWTSVHR